MPSPAQPWPRTFASAAARTFERLSFESPTQITGHRRLPASVAPIPARERCLRANRFLTTILRQDTKRHAIGHYNNAVPESPRGVFPRGGRERAGAIVFRVGAPARR